MKSFFLANSAVVAFADAMNSFSERRAKLGLPNPGAVENLSREAQNNTLIPPGYMFSGIKGEITKLFGTSPFFQVSHQFSMEERNSPYTFSTLYGTNKVGSHKPNIMFCRSAAYIFFPRPGFPPRIG
jgi:mitochondrial import receptor subunit TOM40